MTYHSGMGALLCPPNFGDIGGKCKPANARGCYEQADLLQSKGVPADAVQVGLQHCLLQFAAPTRRQSHRLKLPWQTKGLGAIALPACVTQAQHDAAVTACKYQTVKGLGVDVSGISPCVVKDLPVCPPLVRASAPTSTYVPPSVDISTPPEPQPEESEPNYMLWGGLGLLLVAAGGYVVYKTTKK